MFDSQVDPAPLQLPRTIARIILCHDDWVTLASQGISQIGLTGAHSGELVSVVRLEKGDVPQSIFIDTNGAQFQLHQILRIDSLRRSNG